MGGLEVDRTRVRIKLRDENRRQVTAGQPIGLPYVPAKKRDHEMTSREKQTEKEREKRVEMVTSVARKEEWEAKQKTRTSAKSKMRLRPDQRGSLDYDWENPPVKRARSPSVPRKSVPEGRSRSRARRPRSGERRGVSVEQRSRLHTQEEPSVRVRQVPQTLPSRSAKTASRSRSRSLSLSERRRMSASPVKKKVRVQPLFPELEIPEASEESDEETREDSDSEELLEDFFSGEAPIDFTKE